MFSHLLSDHVYGQRQFAAKYKIHGGYFINTFATSVTIKKTVFLLSTDVRNLFNLPPSFCPLNGQNGWGIDRFISLFPSQCRNTMKIEA